MAWEENWPGSVAAPSGAVSSGFGDWGPEVWMDRAGTTANSGPQVQANDILTNASVTQGEDRWTGFFQNLLGGAVSYAVQKDAAQSGLVRTTASNGAPVYQPAGVAAPVLQQQAIGGMSIGGVLLIAGAIAAAVLLSKQ